MHQVLAEEAVANIALKKLKVTESDEAVEAKKTKDVRDEKDGNSKKDVGDKGFSYNKGVIDKKDINIKKDVNYLEDVVDKKDVIKEKVVNNSNDVNDNNTVNNVEDKKVVENVNNRLDVKKAEASKELETSCAEAGKLPPKLPHCLPGPPPTPASCVAESLFQASLASDSDAWIQFQVYSTEYLDRVPGHLNWTEYLDRVIGQDTWIQRETLGRSDPIIP